MSRSNRFLIRTALVLAPLLLVEIVTRLLFPVPVPMLIPSRDPKLIYELNPEYPEIDALGMRQAELDPATLDGKFVIAVIGDSHAYSTRSPRAEQSFPARLEQHLAARTGRPVQVLNFGVPGYDMTQELEVLESRALGYEPDLVILQYCLNDEHISNYIWPRHPGLNRALHTSRFVSMAWMQLLYSEFGTRHLLGPVEEHAPDLLLFTPGLVGTPRSHDPDPARAPHPPRDPGQLPARYREFVGRDYLEQNVRTFGRVAREAGAGIVATGFIEERDRALYESSGFEVLSYFEIFPGRELGRFGYDPSHTDTHFNVRGSDRIGAALAEFVAARFADRLNGPL